MKNSNIGFGILLIAVGIIWILYNMGYIDMSVMSSLRALWPLIFVVIGINIIFKENAAVKTITWLLFIFLIIGYSIYMKANPGKHIIDAPGIIMVPEKVKTTFEAIKIYM